MTDANYRLPEVVDLAAARPVAEELLRHIQTTQRPGVDASALRQGGVSLLQILIAAQQQARVLGKSLAVRMAPDSALSGLFATFGLDPALCGAPADLVPGPAAHSNQRT